MGFPELVPLNLQLGRTRKRSDTKFGARVQFVGGLGNDIAKNRDLVYQLGQATDSGIKPFIICVKLSILNGQVLDPSSCTMIVYMPPLEG